LKHEKGFNIRFFNYELFKPNTKPSWRKANKVCISFAYPESRKFDGVLEDEDIVGIPNPDKLE